MPRFRLLPWILVVAVVCAPRAWAGETARAEAEAEADGARPILWPTLAALVPGLAASGAGHFVAGERRTAGRLLILQSAGLGLGAAGAAPLVLTGASRRWSGPPIMMVISGAGLFAVSWFADIYGSAGGPGLAGEPRLLLPPLEVQAGYIFLGDPQFSFENLASLEGTLRAGPWRLSPSAWIAVDGDSQRGRLEGACRFLGPGTSRPLGDGTFLELQAAGTYHRFGDERFSTYVGELFAAGRYDMGRLGGSLRGSFAELGLGVGLELFDYRVEGAGADLTDLLLGRFAYGLYLGSPGAPRGELALYYNHRRDNLAAGLSPGSKNGSGFVGQFGAAGFLDVSSHWGVSADFAVGAAYVAQVGLRYLVGGRP